jgi:hypothetical protein
MRLLLAAVCLAVAGPSCACEGVFSDAARWPYVVTLAPGSHETLADEPLACAPRPGETIAVAGTFRANDLYVAPEGDFALAELPTGSTWIRAVAPLAASERAFLLALAGEFPRCASVLVRPFAGGRHVVVEADAGIFVADLSARRARILDHRAATLEGCRMSARRDVLECSLDLSWSSTRFDAEGHELDGTFVPAWTYTPPPGR